MFSGDDLEKRLNTLRSSFGRVLHKTGESGRGADGKIDPTKLFGRHKWLWERLDFLETHIKPRKTKSTMVCISVYEGVKINVEYKNAKTATVV
jgi:hypothetical protein